MVKNMGPKKFTMGEVDAVFGNKTLSLDVGGTKTEFDVSTVAGDTFMLHGKDGGAGVAYVNGLVGNLHYTTVMGLSSFGNTTYPESFAQGMRSNSTENLVMF